MRISIPYLLTALFLLVPSANLFAADSGKNPDTDLLAAYDKGVKVTEHTSPVVRKLFDHLHDCVPTMGQSQVMQAEGKAEAERAEQNKAMDDSVSILKKADAAIKAEVDAQLKRGLHVDTSKVDVCQGESDTFKKMLDDAKAKAKAGAAHKIESIASSLREKLKGISGKINAQMQKNSHDKPEDVAGLNKAKSWVFSSSSKKACDDAIKMVSSEATNRDLSNYQKYLQDLDKKISAWKDQKNNAVAAEVDEKIDQQVAPKLVDRNKCGSAVAKKAESTKKPEPSSSVSKAEKPASAADSQSDKAAVTGQPTKTAEAPKPEAAPKVTKAPQQADAAAAAAKENSANSVTGDLYKEVPPPNEKKPAAVTADNYLFEDTRIKDLKPLTAEDVARTDTYQSNSDAEIKPTEATPGIDMLDNSVSKQTRAEYQQNEIFTQRDLDFDSSKDTTYIQNALNEVRAQNGLAEISADGVFGSRTTVALDQVMQDPAQKAAFIKALRAQMSGRSTASK